jgi:hypothetical protein
MDLGLECLDPSNDEFTGAHPVQPFFLRDVESAPHPG